jgi:hypothetical protein
MRAVTVLIAGMMIMPSYGVLGKTDRERLGILAQRLMLDPTAKDSPTKGVFPQYWMFPEWAIPSDLRESERPRLDRPKRDPRPVG